MSLTKVKGSVWDSEDNDLGVNVKDYGAVGDWNGTTGTDDTAAIQAAIDSFGQEVGATATGGTVYFPAGNYLVTSQITVYSGIHIVGAGMQATKFACKSVSAGNYCFKNANNARYFSYRDFTITGESTTTAQGGISVGNDSGDSGFSAYISIKNVEIIGFSTTNATALLLANPSHMQLSNVTSYVVPNGECCVLIASMTNTGVINFSGCKFGEWAASDTGMRIDNATGASAAISEISFNGCFFGGTTRGLDLNVLSGSANESRNLQFNACHFEVDNATAGSECVLIKEVQGASFINCGFHGNSNTNDGIKFDHSGLVEGVDIRNCYFVGIATNCVNVGSGGAGSYRNITVGGIYTLDTTPVLLVDPLGVATQEKFTKERNNSDLSSSGTGETNLHTIIIPAKELGNIGGVRVIAAGTKTGSAGTKTIKLYFGTTSLTGGAATAVIPAGNNTNDWRVEAYVENTAYNAQRISWVSYDYSTIRHGYVETTEDTDAGTTTIKITAQCANAADSVTQKIWHVESVGA